MKSITKHILTCLGIHLLFIELFVSAGKKPRDYSPAIYYGDSDVNIGNPFSITCIISISDPIEWLKDGESITKHNLRHGKDVHAFFLSEHAIEGESDKIEARLSVKHALQIHEGKYQCNSLHSSYHYLRVHRDITKYDGPTTHEEEQTINYDYSPSTIYSQQPPLIPPPRLPPPPSSSSSSSSSVLHGHGGHGDIWPVDMNITRQRINSNLNTMNTEIDNNNLYMINYNENQLQHEKLPKSRHRGGGNNHIDDQRSKLPSSYYFEHQPTELTTRNVMRNTPSSSSSPSTSIIPTTGSVQIIHRSKTTDFYLDSRETDVTSMEDDDNIGMSLRPFLTTSSPLLKQQQQQQHRNVGGAEILDTTNLYSKRPPSQQQQSLPSSVYVPTSGIAGTIPTITTGTTGRKLSSPHQPALLPLPTSSITMTNSNIATTRRQDHHHHTLTAVTAAIPAVVPNTNREDSDGQTASGTPIVVYNIYRNLTLNCDIPQIGDREIVWERNGTEVTKDDGIKGRYKIKDHKFIIDKTLLVDAGLYSCYIKDEPSERRSYRAHAQVEVRVPSNLGVVEGETLKIQCTVIGTEPLIKWEHENDTISNSTGRYVLKNNDNDIPNAVLEIVNASLQDRGEYKCVGQNKGAELASKPAMDTSFVRVKGKLAALWPFLGICAEVFVLCAIILIYEKKRNKTDLDESDTDPNTEQEKLKSQRN